MPLATSMQTDYSTPSFPGNSTSSDAGNATRATSAAVQEGTAALFAALEAAGRSGTLTDATLLLAASGILVSCCCYRPKLTSVFVLMWVLWLIFRFLEGHAAWTDIAEHARHARETTETAVGATWAMLVSWFILAAPVAVDLQRLLEPAVLLLQQRWDALSLKERFVGMLFLLAICSSVLAVRALWRHQDTVKDVGFQLSFALCGPCIWWLTVQLPHNYSALLVGAVMSIVPSAMSIMVLSRLEVERSAKQKAVENSARDTRLFASLSRSLEELDQPFADAFSEELETRLRMWVSYWACWPFFNTAYTLIIHVNFINDKEKPAVDGIFVAVIIWAQFWRASRIAPYVFAVCAVCLRSFTEQTTHAAHEAGSQATSFAVRHYATFAGNVSERQWLMIGLVVLAAIVVVAVLLRVVAIAEALITLLFLVAVAFDCARCAARRMCDVYASRLSFWVIAMIWLQLRRIPVFGSVLTVWTPFVLVAALLAGETLLHALLYMIWKIATWVRHRCCGLQSGPDLDSYVQTKKDYEEVSREERQESTPADDN